MQETEFSVQNNMQIVICDDDKVQLDYLESLINRWSKSHLIDSHEPIKVNTYISSEQFLFDYEDKNHPDLLILDIQMKEMSGMELARTIRSKGNEVKIIFVTGIKDYVFEGYEVGAIRYILKPIEEASFMKLLSGVYEEIDKSKDNYMIFSYQGENRKIRYSNIIAISVDGHYVKMVTVDEILEWKDTLNRMKELVSNHNFILCNRSTLVNICHIEKINKNECIVTKRASEINSYDISRNCYKSVNEAFIGYYKKQ